MEGQPGLHRGEGWKGIALHVLVLVPHRVPLTTLSPPPPSLGTGEPAAFRGCLGDLQSSALPTLTTLHTQRLSAQLYSLVIKIVVISDVRDRHVPLHVSGRHGGVC